MTNAELVNLLQKVSVVAIYKLSNGSRDYFTVSDAIIRVQSRPIIGAVQINRTFQLGDDSLRLDFAFSPDFLNSNHRLNVDNLLNALSWSLMLPDYSYEDDDSLELYDGQIVISDEEGVANWLSRGTVKINEGDTLLLMHCSIEELHNAYFSYEQL